ncbi:Natural resistance-associated macrophage protein [Plasmodiophora brassicae]
MGRSRSSRSQPQRSSGMDGGGGGGSAALDDDDAYLDRVRLVDASDSIELSKVDRSLSLADSEDWNFSPRAASPTTFSWNRLLVFMGPGFLVSTSFVDPGNFDTDIQAGAQFRYELVYVLVGATALGLLLQNLAARLGVVTGMNLAEICAHEYPGRVRYILWAIAEVTIVASDIPEVVGTAFALRFLFGMPLWIGVIVTSLSVVLFLMVNVFGVRKLELLIGSLIGVVLICFVGELLMSTASLGGILGGLIPTFNLRAMYAATSLIGSVVMPHNIFLHSALVQTRSVRRTSPAIREACYYNFIESCIALSISLVINVSILAMSASEFFPNPHAGLLSAPALLQRILKGSAGSTIFAIALLASGQSSTMTGTYAGQFVMEGFLDLKIEKWARALLTRSVAIVPSLIAALVAGEHGADRLIILSQVALSVLLPFSLIPLFKVTSSHERMGEFANGRTVKVVVIALGAGVTLANLALVFAELVPVVGAMGGFTALLASCMGLVVFGGYLSLFAYLLVRPVTTHSLLDLKPA